MRSFASDNNSGVHPRVMDAIIKANDNHAVGYGDDPWTEAATSKIQEVFGKDASPFFVFNGTGANSVALQAVTRPVRRDRPYQRRRMWSPRTDDRLRHRHDPYDGR